MIQNKEKLINCLNLANEICNLYSSSVQELLEISKPNKFNQKTPINKIINISSFSLNLILSIYSFYKANKLIESGGKLTMLKDLEKQRFIKENLTNQARYITGVSNTIQPLSIEDKNCSDKLPLQSTAPLPKSETIITQQSHHSLPNHYTASLEDLICPNCGSDSISANGSSRGKSRFKCNYCQKTFGI